MKESALKSRLKVRAKWRHRLIILFAALLFAAIISFVQVMPGAATLSSDNQSLKATKIYTAALYNLRPASVMQVDGDTGKGLKVTVSTGRLTGTTRTNLAALGFNLPDVKGAHFQWMAIPPANGRIAISIANEREAPDAGVMFQATGSAHVPELNIRAVQTALTVSIAVATQGGEASPMTDLKFGDRDFSDSTLAFVPIQIEIPPGEWMNLTFDNEDALKASSFALGERLDTGGSGSVLPVGRAEVGMLAPGTSTYPRLQTVDWRVCSAPRGKLLYTRLSPRPDDCRLVRDPKIANDNLYATDITVEPNSVTLELEGSGYILKDGRPQPAKIWSALMANPLISVAIALSAAAMVRSLWRLWVGRDL